jgi:hypothetical protein
VWWHHDVDVMKGMVAQRRGRDERHERNHVNVLMKVVCFQVFLVPVPAVLSSSRILDVQAK